jgi:hypothetical protein
LTEWVLARSSTRGAVTDLYSSGFFSFFDEFPKLFGFGEGGVFTGIEFGAEEEIFEGIFVEDAVDDDAFVGDFEVDAVFGGAEAVESFAFPIEAAETFIIEGLEVLGGDFELGEEFELLGGGKLGDLGGGDFVEDDLEHGF